MATQKSRGANKKLLTLPVNGLYITYTVTKHQMLFEMIF